MSKNRVSKVINSKKLLQFIFYPMLLFLYIFNVSGQDEKVSYTVYSNESEGFSVRVPKGWHLVDQHNEVVIYITVETPQNDPVHAFNIQKIPVTFSEEESSLAAIDFIAQQFYDQLSGIEGFGLITDKYISINNRKIREMILSFRYDGVTLIQSHTILYHNGTVFVLIYTADERVYNAQIHKMALSSFSFDKRSLF